jgi:SAM-dependent methyltransferase
LSCFTDPAQRVGWISSKSQNARFEAFLEIGDLQGKRVLDVGCGLGDFYGFLKSKGWTGSYTGFDRMNEMVAEARQRRPGTRFECCNIAEKEPDEHWDYVFMSGLFNHRVRDNWGWIAQVVGPAYRLAQCGTAFNLLSDTSPDQDDDFFYASPKDLERFAAALAPGRWKIIPCARPHDLTVFLYP